MVFARYKSMFRKRTCLLVWMLFVFSAPRWAFSLEAKPVVIVGAESSEIEKYAAQQLCEYLNKLFAIRETPATSIPDASTVVLLVGSPTSNPLVAEALGPAGWPHLTDQGIALKHARLKDMPAFVIGGGSPRATLWAVYELVERWGVRYLLHGDLLPEEPGLFRLPSEDVELEPVFTVRQWRVVNCFGFGPESWGIEDYRPVIDQLVKLKFNRIFAAIYPWQPFLDLKQKGIEREQAWLWWNFHLPITDDMPGRRLFGTLPEWWNPDLPYGADYKEMAAAGRQHLHGLFAHAKRRGFEVGMTVNIAEFTPEFAPLLKDYRKSPELLGSLTVMPGPLQPADDPDLCELAAQVVKTTVNTYPEVDFIVSDVPEIPAWTDAYQTAWTKLDAKYDLESRFPIEKLLESAGNRRGYAGGKERPVTEVKTTIAALYVVDKLISEYKVLADTKRPDAFLMFCSMAEEVLPLLPYVLPKGSETLNQLDYTPERIVSRPEAFANVGGDMRHNLIFTLHDDNVGLLPMSNASSLSALTDLMQKHGWSGFSSRYWLISDHDPCVAFLARRSWDDKTTLAAIYDDQFSTACGSSAASDLKQMISDIENVTVELNQHGLGLTFPVGRSVITRHLVSEPMPAQMVAWRQSYQRALEAAQRAYDKSTERGKPYVAYWIGRIQFGIGFFDCVEVAHELATAQEKLKQALESHDEASIAKRRTEVAELATHAVQTARDMVESFSAVARDRSDRGAIAAMVEYVYRPLQDESIKCQQ